MGVTDLIRELLAAVWRRPAGLIGLVTLAVVLVAGLFAPPFLPDPAAQPDIVAQASLAPGPGHLFGTD